MFPTDTQENPKTPKPQNPVNEIFLEIKWLNKWKKIIRFCT